MTRVLLVLSGKGGVGKSSVAAQAALALAQQSSNNVVGVLDADLTGPSIPRILCGEALRETAVFATPGGAWRPVRVPLGEGEKGGSLGSEKKEADGENAGASGGADQDGARPQQQPQQQNNNNNDLRLMSIGFLLGRGQQDSAVVWRGPKKTAMIGQLLSNVEWGTDLDWLVIDTPPGTGDEHIALVQTLQAMQQAAAADPQQQPQGPAGAQSLRLVPGPDAISVVLVTTPQAVAVGDVLREATFCKKLGLPIVGVVENMSGFECPCCGEVTNIFSSGGGALLAERIGAPLLGSLPINPELATAMDSAEDGALAALTQRLRTATAGQVFDKLREGLAAGSNAS